MNPPFSDRYVTPLLVAATFTGALKKSNVLAAIQWLDYACVWSLPLGRWHIWPPFQDPACLIGGTATAQSWVPCNLSQFWLLETAHRPDQCAQFLMGELNPCTTELRLICYPSMNLLTINKPFVLPVDVLWSIIAMPGTGWHNENILCFWYAILIKAEAWCLTLTSNDIHHLWWKILSGCVLIYLRLIIMSTLLVGLDNIMDLGLQQGFLVVMASTACTVSCNSIQMALYTACCLFTEFLPSNCDDTTSILTWRPSPYVFYNLHTFSFQSCCYCVLHSIYKLPWYLPL